MSGSTRRATLAIRSDTPHITWVKIRFLAFGLLSVAAFHVLAEDPTSNESQAERLFQNFDTNHDGVISLDEYRAGMAGNMSEARVAKVFTEKDRNGDGVLSLEELLYVPQDQRAPIAVTKKKEDHPIREAQASKEAQRYFDKLDTNRDGFISLGEYLVAMAAQMPSHRAEKVFKEKDRNGDGRLSFEEFTAVAQGQKAAPVALPSH
jgi:Ca2+-binding EF-hand superfamily protein